MNKRKAEEVNSEEFGSYSFSQGIEGSSKMMGSVEGMEVLNP
jgi:hypothetical protein